MATAHARGAPLALCACALPRRYVRGGGSSRRFSAALSRCWVAGAGGGCCEGCVLLGLYRGLFPGWRSLTGRYGGDSRSGVVSSGVTTGAGSVRGEPGRLEPVSWRGWGVLAGGGGCSGWWEGGGRYLSFIERAFAGGGTRVIHLSLYYRSALVSHGNQHRGCPAAPSGKCP